MALCLHHGFEAEWPPVPAKLISGGWRINEKHSTRTSGLVKLRSARTPSMCRETWQRLAQFTFHLVMLWPALSSSGHVSAREQPLLPNSHYKMTLSQFSPGWDKTNTALCLHHHHHHVAPSARTSMTLSRYPSLSFIASGRSSRLHPVSTQSCSM